MGWGKVVGYKGSGRFCLGMVGSIRERRERKEKQSQKGIKGTLW